MDEESRNEELRQKYQAILDQNMATGFPDRDKVEQWFTKQFEAFLLLSNPEDVPDIAVLQFGQMYSPQLKWLGEPAQDRILLVVQQHTGIDLSRWINDK